jgi:hypothetical protein
MRWGWGALLVGAALMGAASPTAQGRAGHGRLQVGALVLPNCLLQVQAVPAQPLVSVKLRCGQVTHARVHVEPEAPRTGARPWTMALTVARAPDPFGETGWMANGRFIASSEGVWAPAPGEDVTAPAARQLTVHVDF